MRLRELNPGYPSLLCVLRHLQSHGLEPISYASDSWLSAFCHVLNLAQYNGYFSLLMVLISQTLLHDFHGTTLSFFASYLSAWSFAGSSLSGCWRSQCSDVFLLSICTLSVVDLASWLWGSSP